jgi:hypothetical protein
MREVPSGRSTSAPPAFLRVEEAAAVLRIGRTAAYELARRFLDTDGGSGLPVIRIGKQLRVPRHRLEELAGGPIPWPETADVDPSVSEPDTRTLTSGRPATRDSRRHRQPKLPFSA